MDQVLVESAKQVPALVVLVAVVWIFIRSMTSIGAECHKVQLRSTEALERNTHVLGEIRGILLKLNGRT